MDEMEWEMQHCSVDENVFWNVSHCIHKRTNRPLSIFSLALFIEPDSCYALTNHCDSVVLNCAYIADLAELLVTISCGESLNSVKYKSRSGYLYSQQKLKGFAHPSCIPNHSLSGSLPQRTAEDCCLRSPSPVATQTIKWGSCSGDFY